MLTDQSWHKLYSPHCWHALTDQSWRKMNSQLLEYVERPVLAQIQFSALLSIRLPTSSGPNWIFETIGVRWPTSPGTNWILYIVGIRRQTSLGTNWICHIVGIRWQTSPGTNWICHIVGMRWQTSRPALAQILFSALLSIRWQTSLDTNFIHSCYTLTNQPWQKYYKVVLTEFLKK